MTQQRQVYRCYVCGNVVEVLAAGGGELICCGAPMVLLKEKTAEAGQEKHVPVVEWTAKGVRVRVGASPHPMEAGHWIEWLEVSCNGQMIRQHLLPEQAAEALFDVPAGDLVARAYCNRHGLWQTHLRRSSASAE